MSIRELEGKIKTLVLNDRVFIATLVVLVAAASFALGRLSVEEGVSGRLPAAAFLPQEIQKSTTSTSTAVEETPSSFHVRTETLGSTTAGAYVGSKNGTKYHLPWCSGAKRISEENKIWFGSKEEATRAGYTPAANCPGI